MNHWSDEYFSQGSNGRPQLTLGQFQEVQRLALQMKMDHIRQELRIEFAKLPRFARWFSAKVWPEIFNDL